MAKTFYKGKSYNSKADLIRELYDEGKLSNDSISKKNVAKDLGITVQTVHATLIKILDKSPSKIETVGKLGRPSKAVIITSDNIDITEGKRIEVTWAPNVWGLPITNPPIVVIDKTFKGDIFLPVDKNAMIDLIQY